MIDDATLTEHVCQALAGAGPGWKYQTTGYGANDVGIFYGDLGASPDAAVGVEVYATDDDPVTGTAARYVQLHFRGRRGVRRDADAMAGQAFAALHGLHHTGPVSRYVRTSSTQLGVDANGRQERADNYQIILTPAP